MLGLENRIFDISDSDTGVKNATVIAITPTNHLAHAEGQLRRLVTIIHYCSLVLFVLIVAAYN